MLPALLGCLAAAPAYWLAVPRHRRREAAALLGLLVLAVLDPRLPVLAMATAAVCWLVTRDAEDARWRGPAVVVVLGCLAGLFVWNKHAGGAPGSLATQGRLALVGVSYLVLKAAALLIDAARGALAPRPRFLELVAWIAFAPTFVAGPIEPFQHFRAQTPRWRPAALLDGTERVLFGAVKALVVAHWLGVWAAPVIAAPAQYGRGACLAALWALAWRFYLDFAGYSDIAIGLARILGFRIQENFDAPFVRRNLVLLWQHWHMTLTRWLRDYLFVPISRALLRRARWLGDRPALAVAQIVTMVFCGLWHGVAWNFATWGLVHALGLVWVGLVARDVGRALPPVLVGWWRTSSLARVAATLLTFQYFSLSLVFVVLDVPGAVAYLQRILLP